jgi:cytochrome c-type biogenesis protein CcmE
MGRIFVSLVVFFIVMGSVLVYQATQGTSSLVLMPSEVLAKAHASDLPRIRVGGRVVDPIEYQTEPVFLLRFSVRDPQGSETSVPVEYRGLKPDMFQAGRDVLVDGDFRDGKIVAAKLQTQCPSKYEPAMPGSSAGGAASQGDAAESRIE